jgi:tetratricopeptide (TPR) repeat protein
MGRARTLVALLPSIVATGLLVPALAQADADKPAAPTDATAAAMAESSKVKPAAERLLPVSAGKGVTVRTTATPSTKGTALRPAFRGVRVPDALAPRLKAQMDARVERNLIAIRSLRGEAATLLETFVRESPRDAREMPEALLRLGELKWEIEREEFVERFRQWELTPVGKRGAAPEMQLQPSRDLFARVLADYPHFRDYDLALYVDGFLASEQGKNEEALARFERILAEYPQSRFIADAHMARAEYLFGTKSDFSGALAEYDRVLGYKDTELRGLALFKSAWCLWRLGRNEEAVRRFVSVFEVADAEGKSNNVQRRRAMDELQTESLKYLVEVFTEDDRNSAGDMFRFLQRIGGDRFAGRIVKALATQFYDQAHYERGIEAYELLLRLDPTNAEAPDWMLEITRGYASVEDWQKLRESWDRALVGYAHGSPWSRTQADPTAAARTAKKLESQLRREALDLHARAQRDRTSRSEWEGALGLYEVYLAHFSKEPNAYQVHYYAGEIDFYHLERNTDAAVHYMAAARAIPDAAAKGSKELSNLRRDALYNAIAALERVRVAELEAKKGKGAQESETDKRFAEALELYAQLYPTDPALPELFFRQGKLYYDYAVYDPAVKIWGTLLEKFPNSTYAGPAGELLLDSFNRSKNYENIETWARRLKAVPAFRSAKQQERLDTLIVQAVFKQGEQKAQRGEHGAAAVAYLRAAKEFPKDARAGQACANAAIEAKKAGDLGTLKAAGSLAVSKDYRSHPEAPLSAWTAATTLQSMGLFGEAADFSEGIVQNATKEQPHFQKFEHTKDAAYNAVVLRAATGETDKAIQNGQRFLVLYKGTPEADEVYFQMARAAQAAGKDKEAVDLYKRFLGTKSRQLDHRVQGHVLYAQALVRTGDEKEAEKQLSAAVQYGRKQARALGPDGKFAAAQARYLQGERVLARFEQIQIAGDVKQLSKRLKQKSDLLKQAAKIFLDVVTMGVAEWTTAALFQIGRTYELFAKSLREAPPPAGLSESDRELYTQQIEEFVVPVEERSLEAYENGWQKAIDLGIYNQWTAKMREALGRLNGELYPPFKEVGFEVRSQGNLPLPAYFDAPKAGRGSSAAATPPAPKSSGKAKP